FFFQAEDGIRDGHVTGVQTCALPIYPGYAVNPAQIERQITGCVVFSLSALFYEECTVNNGCIVQENFDSYDSMRIAQMPKVESKIGRASCRERVQSSVVEG